MAFIKNICKLDMYLASGPQASFKMKVHHVTTVHSNLDDFCVFG